ncbi:hypothetical protein AAMO2058_001361600 [Amorphochlora amoebiformis]
MRSGGRRTCISPHPWTSRTRRISLAVCTVLGFLVSSGRKSVENNRDFDDFLGSEVKGRGERLKVRMKNFGHELVEKHSRLPVYDDFLSTNPLAWRPFQTDSLQDISGKRIIFDQGRGIAQNIAEEMDPNDPNRPYIESEETKYLYQPGQFRPKIFQEANLTLYDDSEEEKRQRRLQHWRKDANRFREHLRDHFGQVQPMKTMTIGSFSVVNATAETDKVVTVEDLDNLPDEDPSKIVTSRRIEPIHPDSIPLNVGLTKSDYLEAKKVSKEAYRAVYGQKAIKSKSESSSYTYATETEDQANPSLPPIANEARNPPPPPPRTKQRFVEEWRQSMGFEGRTEEGGGGVWDDEQEGGDGGRDRLEVESRLVMRRKKDKPEYKFPYARPYTGPLERGTPSNEPLRGTSLGRGGKAIPEGVDILQDMYKRQPVDGALPFMEKQKPKGDFSHKYTALGRNKKYLKMELARLENRLGQENHMANWKSTQGQLKIKELERNILHVKRQLYDGESSDREHDILHKKPGEIVAYEFTGETLNQTRVIEINAMKNASEELTDIKEIKKMLRGRFLKFEKGDRVRYVRNLAPNP